MTIQNSDRHGVWVNDGSGTPKLIHAAWVNNGGTTAAAKEIWINNAQTLTRVWPPRAYVVELVPIGTRHGNADHLFTAVDSTTLSIAQGTADPQWNSGNWNALWGGMRYYGEGSVTYAFRRWDKYDTVGNYDFSTANAVRRTTATASTPGNVGFGHGGLWKNLLRTSPYDPNDKRTHSPFVVIEPGSKILCIRTNFAKLYSQGSDEGGSSPVATIGLYSGNDTYFGSTSTTTHTWSSTVTNDIPVTGGENGAQPASPAAASGIFATTSTNNTFFTNFGMVYGKGSCRFGISTHSSFGPNTLNVGSWMNNKNYGSSPTSTIYGFGDNNNRLTIPSVSFNVVPYTLPTPTISGHVGWKYIQFDYDDSAASNGYVYENYNIPTSSYSASDWGAVGVNTSLGSTLFLVIPP